MRVTYGKTTCELKPCPFCGGEPRFVPLGGTGPDRDYGLSITCDCGGTMVSGFDLDQQNAQAAADMWNRSHDRGCLVIEKYTL